MPASESITRVAPALANTSSSLQQLASRSSQSTAPSFSSNSAMSQGAQQLAEPSTSGTQTYDGLTFISHMLAGSVAGTVEHTAMYPVDTIKTRMQALFHHPGHAGATLPASVRQALMSTIRSEGIVGLYRGLGAVAAGAGPAHAMHFAVYEYAKEALGGNEDGLHPIETALAGCSATVVNDALMTPVDCVKQRLQVEGSPYKGVMDAARRIIAAEGVGALYRSYRTTLIMNVPFTAMHFSVYETAKKLMIGDDEEAEETLKTQLIAGGMAGGAAAAITTPLDVVKTRLQLGSLAQAASASAAVSSSSAAAATAQPAAAGAAAAGGMGAAASAAASTAAAAAVAAESAASKYSGDAVLPMLRTILREEGMAGLMAGLKPRVLFHIPAAAVCWGTYESMKSMLGAKN